MFTREIPTTTLVDLHEELSRPSDGASCDLKNIEVDLVHDRIRFPRLEDGETVEVPATSEAVILLGETVDVPTAFLKRVPVDLRQTILTALLSRSDARVAIDYEADSGIYDINPAGAKLIDPRRSVDVAINVMGPDSVVVEHWGPRGEFRFDAIVAPTEREQVPDEEVLRQTWRTGRGVGGDAAVGDLTAGGLRFGQDTKHNLAPWVQPFSLRLACTNGMETFDAGLKVDARGSTVEEFMEELEAAAERAFSRVESDIAAFYDLRNERVTNPERVLTRLADEHSLPDRTLTQLIRMAASEEIPDEPTQFDLVNLVTNQAVDPQIRHRTGARRTLERVGGSVVAEHAARCGHCHARLL